jgi:hypothetical protein
MSDGRIYVRDARNACSHEMKCFLPQSGLETVGDVTSRFAAKVNRVLADLPIERQSALNSILGGHPSARDLNQRDKMRRIKGVTENHTLRVAGASVLKLADSNGRGACRNKCVRRSDLIEVME